MLDYQLDTILFDFLDKSACSKNYSLISLYSLSFQSIEIFSFLLLLVLA